MVRYGRTEMDLLWTMDVPHLSFAFDAVLSGVLGLAATHFLSYDPKNIDMKRSAQYYLAKTVRQLSTLVSRLDMETAEPVMLVAMFIALQMRVRAAFVLDDEPYHLPLECFHVHKGVEIVYLKSIPFIQRCNLLVALGAEAAVYQTDPLCKEVLPSRIWRDSRSLLEGTDTEGFDLQARRIYEGALTYLNTIYIALLKGEDAQWTRRRLCGMPAHVPPAFVGLLEQQDSRAMAILARFLALMKPGDGIWYHHGCAEYEVEGIASLMPPDWLWAMEWPRQILTSDSFLALVLAEPVQRCLEIRPISDERVFLGAEEVLARHRKSRICLEEYCHCFLRSGDEELSTHQ